MNFPYMELSPGGVCISISAVVELAQGGSATNGATPFSLLQIVTT